jgi:methyl-accepting chemotaxis protein
VEVEARSEEPRPVDSATELARLMEENAALLADLQTGGTATAEMTARAKEISTRITEVRRAKEERAKVLPEFFFASQPSP